MDLRFNRTGQFQLPTKFSAPPMLAVLSPATEPVNFRHDVNALRALAVMSVVVFHLGYGDMGYLGVDVFFVISGFLIIGIIDRDLRLERFRFRKFFDRRIRRLMPLSLVVVAISLLTGCILMLPDDLQNLGQSAVATNLFSNNLLQIVTTGNYWDVVNDYKPLLHTWSLGVEEQFYLVFPAVLYLTHKLTRLNTVSVVSVAFAASLVLNFLPFSDAYLFYLLPFRIFELAFGGMLALVLVNRRLNPVWGVVAVVGLFISVSVAIPGLPAFGQLLLAVMLTGVVLRSDLQSVPTLAWLMSSPVVYFLGVTSYGIYLWHQPVFAFARYAFFEDFSFVLAIALVLLTLLLSGLTYVLIESPFRSRAISFKFVAAFVVPLFLVTTASGALLHYRGGVVRAVPELGIDASSSGAGLHSGYNSRIFDYDSSFGPRDESKVRVAVIGNSFARDWGNVLLESDSAPSIDLAYNSGSILGSLPANLRDAEVFFLTDPPSPEAVKYAGIPLERVWVIGPKNFGSSSGIFYNHRGEGKFSQTAVVAPQIIEQNSREAEEWGSRHVDLLQAIGVNSGRVPVFTPQGKFYSQDTRHLTQYGAEHLSRLLSDEIERILKVSRNGS